jgi:hypothetical protein
MGVSNVPGVFILGGDSRMKISNMFKYLPILVNLVLIGAMLNLKYGTTRTSEMWLQLKMEAPGHALYVFAVFAFTSLISWLLWKRLPKSLAVSTVITSLLGIIVIQLCNILFAPF